MAPRRAACLAFAFAAALLAPSAGEAHGETDWIEKNPVWGWCCGPQDCRRAAPGEVVRTPKGFAIPSTDQVFRDGMRGFFQHRHDQDIWLCKTGDIVRCLFIPEGLL